MSPPQTSLIPTAVALTKFLEVHGFSAFNINYPFWYLGSTPYKFLIGPLIPVLLSFIHRILINSNLFSITIYLVLFSILISALGWGILVYKVQNEKSKFIFLIVLILLLIMPWRYLVAIGLDDASFTIARNFLPFVFISYWSFMKKRNILNTIVGILNTSILLLINTNIIPALIVGSVALGIAYSYQEGKIKGFFKSIKYLIPIIAASLLIATFWYSPSYWLTILTNPSIGGSSTLKATLRIFDLFKGIVPLLLAITAVYFSGKIKSRLMLFSLVWFFTFLFLTLFRLISNIDFWQDWTSWFWELEIGIVLMSSKLILGVTHQVFTLIGDVKYPKLLYNRFSEYLIVFGLIFTLFVAANTLYNKLGRPNLLNRQVPEEVLSSLDRLESISKDNIVFLSGSTVFWADSLYDLRQVRGGRDEVSLDTDWDKASWEIRQGSDPKRSYEWISKLNISYILVHTEDSSEYYHDFNNLKKWEKIGKKVWEKNGDEIISVSNE